MQCPREYKPHWAAVRKAWARVWWPWAIFLVDPYNYTMPLFLLSIQRFVTVSEMTVLMPVHLLGIYSFPL